MKKVLCLITAVVLAAAASACSGGGETNTDVRSTAPRTTVATLDSVSALASDGRMDCTKIKLGDIIDRIYEQYPTAPSAAVSQADSSTPTAEPADETYLEKTFGTRLTRFMYKDMQFFTVNGKDSEGVAIMVASDTAYGFKCNLNFRSDIIASLGEPQKSEDLPDDQKFFMMGGEKAERLTYNFGTKRLDFIVTDDILSMIVLTDTTIYTGFGG